MNKAASADVHKGVPTVGRHNATSRRSAATPQLRRFWDVLEGESRYVRLLTEHAREHAVSGRTATEGPCAHCDAARAYGYGVEELT